jgi:hypothetical protein
MCVRAGVRVIDRSMPPQDEVCAEAGVGSYLDVAATDTFVWFGPSPPACLRFQ